MLQEAVGDDQVSHGFDNGDDSGNDTGVVATGDFKVGIVAVGVNCFLNAGDGWCGFDGNFKIDCIAV